MRGRSGRAGGASLALNTGPYNGQGSSGGSRCPMWRWLSTRQHSAGSRKTSGGEQHSGSVRVALANLKIEQCSRCQPPNSPRSLRRVPGRELLSQWARPWGWLKAENHPPPGTASGAAKPTWTTSTKPRTASEKELAGKNVPDVPEELTKQCRI